MRESRSLRILHVTFAPTGGAGQVARTLADAQQEIGLQAEILYQASGPIAKNPLDNPILTGAALIDTFLFRLPSTRQQISIIRSRVSKNIDIDWITENFDVVHLHWTEGMVRREEIGKLLDSGLGIVWTLHDMRPITGACHQSEECTNYESGCKTCPLVRPISWPVSELLHSTNTKIQKKLPITYVSPSEWMMAKALRSDVAKNAIHLTIPNPINELYFQEPKTAKNKENKFIFIANDLSDPNKGFSQVAEWFENLEDGHGMAAIGAVPKGADKYSKVKFHGSLGITQIIQEMDRSEYLLVNSIAESFSLVIAECAARGVIPIITSSLKSVVNEKLINAGVQFFDALEEIPEIIYRIDSNNLRQSLAKDLAKCALENFTPKSIAKKYEKVYRDLV